MNIHQQLAEIEARVLGKVQEWVAHVVFWTTTGASSESGADDQVEHYPTDTDEPTVSQRVRRVAPWGLRGRPPKGVQAAVVRALGNAAQGLLVGIATARYGPQSLEVGETILYCIDNGTYVHLDKNGKLWLFAGTSQVTITKNGDIQVNGGSIKVAAHGDGVDATAAMTTWMAAVRASLTGGALADPGAAPVGIGTINVTSGTRKLKTS